MTSPFRWFQTACRQSLRPVARVARSLLTPPTPPAPFTWHRIRNGPAAGAELLLPEGSAIAQSITEGTYEREVVSVIESLVQTDDGCYDIGGHYGYLSMVLAKLAPRGQIDTFEPVPEHASKIAQAAERSGCTNLTVHQVAVADRSDRMSLRRAMSPETDDSMAYLQDYGGVNTEAAQVHYPGFETISVETVTLDSFSNQQHMPRFLKIDAEGAEAAILKAGLKMIETAKPRLLIEMHGITETLQCTEILQSVGYRAVLLSEQKTTLPVLWVARDDDQAVQCIRSRLGREPTVLFQVT